MNNPKNKVIKFNKILSQLPYMTIGQKVIACTLYLAGDKSTKEEMEKFYSDQLNQLQKKKLD